MGVLVAVAVVFLATALNGDGAERPNYYAVIDHTDREIGRILGALEQSGELANTIIIYSSDHGVSVGSHGLREKQNMCEHSVNVPLIICGPGVPEGAKSEVPVYLRELFPTSCELAGVAVPEGVEGRSFAGILKGEERSDREEVPCYFRDCQRMVREERWKLIYYPQIARFQLFDLANDPYELDDLSEDPQYGETRLGLAEKLAHWRVEVKDPVLQ